MSGLEKAVLARDLKKAKQSITSLEKSCGYYKRRCEILEKIIADHDEKMLPPRGVTQQEHFMEHVYPQIVSSLDQNGPERFIDFVLNEIDINSQKPPQARRWSPITAMFWFAVMSLGPKSYEFARSFITLPSRETFFRIFAEPQDCWRDALLDLNKVRNICALFRRRHDIIPDSLVDVGIGIDAMSMEPFQTFVQGRSVIHNHVFAFMLLPLNPTYKPITLHLLTAPSGNANQTVRSVISELRRRLSALTFNVQFVATDGDSGYSVLHETMFSVWCGRFITRGLESALAVIDGTDVVVSDLLHLFKNARSRIVNGCVTMSISGLFPFTASDLNRILELGNALTDTTSKGKMTDQYPLEIFTIDNFLTLVMKGHFNMAFYILPYSLWNVALRSPNISVQMRMDLLSLVMETFMFYQECLNNLNQKIVSENKQDKIPQYFCSRNHCRRVLNTLLATLREMKRTPTSLALDRVGTHVLECQFGLIRILCHYKHSWKRILRSFTNSMLVTDICSILGHNIKIRSRVNHGGVKITENSLGNIYIPTCDINIREIYELVNIVMEQQSGSPDFGYEMVVQIIPQLAMFVSFISSLSCEIKRCGLSTPKMWSGSLVSHGTIMARLISFCRNPYSLQDEESSDEHQDDGVTSEHHGEEQPPDLNYSGEDVESWGVDGLFLDRETPK